MTLDDLINHARRRANQRGTLTERDDAAGTARLELEGHHEFAAFVCNLEAGSVIGEPLTSDVTRPRVEDALATELGPAGDRIDAVRAALRARFGDASNAELDRRTYAAIAAALEIP